MRAANPLIHLLALVAFSAPSLGAAAEPLADDTRRDVDLVIALDVSGSMEGLIESAKQRLWDITNELAQARPVPALRVAILSYGNPTYGEQTGYVRVDLPFTADLDAVNATLFAFRTNGGDEYVARAIQTSLDKLQWSQDRDALRIVFVAGNESAEQDPQLTIERAAAAAATRGVVVNAIYCGADGDTDARGWQRVATSTNGRYASIDQQAAAVANVATPFDEELAALNAELNSTYVAFGAAGERGRVNQAEQDGNAAAMSPAAAASRTVAKAGALYRADWDLVDAVDSGKALADIPAAELPAELQVLPLAEREAFVREKAERRQDLQRQIGELAASRSEFIAQQSRESAGATGLDAAILEGLREVAATKGFSFARDE
ncbi:MAG TPA: vWA domain-containing protein [Gammaproteobacteria bacterium]|nr:vWA domain-containing protein [Gammaproteobacteria bacterium]